MANKLNNPFTTVFVAGFSEDVTEADLKNVFQSFGWICNIQMVKTAVGTSCGYGFVQFQNASAAASAVRRLNGKAMLGTFKIHVAKSWTKPPQNKPVGGRGNDLPVPKVNRTGLRISKLNEDFMEDTSAVKRVNGKAMLGTSKIPVARSSTKLPQRKPSGSYGNYLPVPISKPEVNRTNLHISNLNEDFTEDQLRKQFEKFGSIESLTIMKKGDSSRGFGFVKYKSPEHAATAVKTMNGTNDISIKPLRVRIAWRGFGDKQKNEDDGYIHVNNLGKHVSEDELRSMFKEFGEIRSVKIVTNDGKSRTFGFVEFYEATSATAAIEGLCGKKIMGSESLYVARAHHKTTKTLQEPRICTKTNFANDRLKLLRNNFKRKYSGK